MQRGALSQAIAWDKISGATLIRTVNRDESEDKWDEQRAPRNFLGRMRGKKYPNFATKSAKSTLPTETVTIPPAKRKFPLHSPTLLSCGNLKLARVNAG